MLASFLRHWRTRFPQYAILASLIVLALIAANSLFSINEFQHRSNRTIHSYEVKAKLEAALSSLKDVQNAARGFVITGKPEFLAPLEEAKRTLPATLSALKKMTADNPLQQKNLETFERQVVEVFSVLENAIELKKKSADAGAAARLVTGGAGNRLMQAIRAHVQAMQDTETALLSQREHQASLSILHTKRFILFGTLAAYFVIGGAFWIIVHQMRQRRHAEAELTRSNDALLLHTRQLESSNKELESFSYSISHDLRIPLRAVSGYARMLEEDYADKIDEEGQRLLNVIIDNSKRMGVLIDDLLAFSRLGRANMSLAEVDMQALAEQLVTEMRKREECAHADIEVESVPPAWGDRALLRQVWVNLLANACKYSSTREQSRIHIGATIEGDECVYAISDNGVGFDMQYYGKLFGVFQRLHSAEEFPGTGVGLAIVQRVIVRHGGRIWAEGKVDQGATFYFSLPVKGGNRD
jgi:signal transduction histidine kinase